LDQQLLQNPLLDGKSIIAIKRSLGQNARTAKSENSATIMANDLGLAPSNFQNNSEIPNPSTGWDNEFIKISLQNGSR
jgi:hypothetical protein